MWAFTPALANLVLDCDRGVQGSTMTNLIYSEEYGSNSTYLLTIMERQIRKPKQLEFDHASKWQLLAVSVLQIEMSMDTLFGGYQSGRVGDFFGKSTMDGVRILILKIRSG